MIFYECQITYIMQCIDKLIADDLTIEPTSVPTTPTSPNTGRSARWCGATGR